MLRLEVRASEERAIGGMASGGYQSEGRIIDFTNRHFEEFERSVYNRMRALGIPDEEIGIRNYPGGGEGAFTRFPETQIGGNINTSVFPNQPRGLGLDHGILDGEHPMMYGVPSWKNAKLSDRVDAAIAHEYLEASLTPPPELSGIEAVKWLHEEGLRRAPYTTLPISSRAREILIEYRRAMGLELD